MNFGEYLKERLRNGKICAPDDLAWLNTVGRDMEQFWDRSQSQMNLLWALRGLGRDHDADKLWDMVSGYQDVHKCALTPADRQQMAIAIRRQYNNPFSKVV